MSCAGGDIDIVVADRHLADNLEFGTGRKNRLINSIREQTKKPFAVLSVRDNLSLRRRKFFGPKLNISDLANGVDRFVR